MLSEGGATQPSPRLPPGLQMADLENADQPARRFHREPKRAVNQARRRGHEGVRAPLNQVPNARALVPTISLVERRGAASATRLRPGQATAPVRAGPPHSRGGPEPIRTGRRVPQPRGRELPRRGRRQSPPRLLIHIPGLYCRWTMTNSEPCCPRSMRPATAATHHSTTWSM